MKVSTIEKWFNKRRYKSNPQNDYFDDLFFDGDKRLITKRMIYYIKNDIVFRLNNGFDYSRKNESNARII